MFQPYCMVFAPLNPFLHDQFDTDYSLYVKKQLFTDYVYLDSPIKISQQQNNSFNSRLNNISTIVNQNSNKTNQIITLLDRLSEDFKMVEEELNSIITVPERQEKDSLLQNQTQESQSFEKAVVSKVQNNRTHPKIKLMENIFGRKEYAYKLTYAGKFPKILFKQRNISLRILNSFYNCRKQDIPQSESIQKQR